MHQEYFVYVLKSLKDNKLYIGVTDNLERRFAQHNNGMSKSTRHRKPFVLLYKELYKSRSDAMKREWYFKNTSDGNIWLKEEIQKI